MLEQGNIELMEKLKDTPPPKMYPIFINPEEMKEKVEQYFRITEREDYSISGFALFLGMTTGTLLNYEKRDGFEELVTWARQKIEVVMEQRADEKGRPFDVFRLKQFGWKDKQEVDLKHSGNISLSALAEARERENNLEDDTKEIEAPTE